MKFKSGHTAWNKGLKSSIETKNKLRQINIGKKHTQETRNKISNANKGQKSSQWVGDNIGKEGVHLWVKKIKGTPRLCEHCKRTDKKKYEWANKDHSYKRISSDYIRLCTSCHRKYDIKNNNYTLCKKKLKN